jgi:predicted acyl esterase
MRTRRADTFSSARRGLFAAVLATALVMGAACTDDSEWEGAPPEPTVAAAEVAELGDDVEMAEFEVRGSVEQISVVGAEPETQLALHDATGTAVATGVTDDQGALIFRLVEPGDGYRVATVEDSDEVVAAEAVDVVAVEESTPDQSFYDDQPLEKGFQYITTRDGTTLSANVTLPGPIEDGPYPTVVEYSGYSPSKPATNLIADRWDDLKGSLPEGLTLEQVCGLAPFACEAPDQPASLIASALGYAVVSVNMRGTGCSGGAYDFFEPLQVLDGYDIIETVAAQPWVLDHRVGMVGLSYPGISQLFVAAAQPPSLAAITPLSVYDDTARGVLAPGGVFNEGFALTWADEVLTNAEPYGQGWEQDVVDAGDETCEQNQELRGQNVDAVSKAQQYPYYDAEVADPLNPSLFASDIEVPVFLTGSFQDEQTGGRFPLLFDEFTNAPVTKFSAWNGAHADGFQPANLVEWKTFLDFYVAGQLTERSLPADLFLPVIMGEVFGYELQLPPQRMFEDQADFAAKRAAYEAEPPIRVRLESGAGDPERPGAPEATLDVRVASWPLPGTTAQAWYLQPDGSLSSTPPEDVPEDSASSFEVTPSLASTRTWEGDDTGELFKADVTYDWRQEPDGAATVFVSEPLESDQVFIGSASADLWVRSATGEADLGVTLSEVRPDGTEIYIQSGTLRATQRALADDATELLPLHTNLESDAAPLPTDEFVEARVEILPFGQIVRAGSRLRMSVHTPGGDKARWSYIVAPQPEGSVIEVGHSAQHPSRLVLPAVAGIEGYPATPPACGSLRAQPCRDFVEYDNTPA